MSNRYCLTLSARPTQGDTVSIDGDTVVVSDDIPSALDEVAALAKRLGLKVEIVGNSIDVHGATDVRETLTDAMSYWELVV